MLVCTIQHTRPHTLRTHGTAVAAGFTFPHVAPRRHGRTRGQAYAMLDSLTENLVSAADESSVAYNESSLTYDESHRRGDESPPKPALEPPSHVCGHMYARV